MIVQERVPLAPLTTFGVGGEARFFIEAQSVEEVKEALEFARERALKVFVLGGGSNILVADEGFDGLVLCMRISGIESVDKGTQTFVSAGAGVLWDELVVWTVAHELAGFECLSGVPGTVGGAVVANLGCYGAQTSDTFVSAEVLDLTDASGTVRTLQKEECLFAYHDSVFSHEPGRYFIVRATFALARGGVPHISYRDNRFDLAKRASTSGHPPTLADVRSAVLEVRAEKGVLRDSYKSAGSFFHMPYVSAAEYAHIEAQACARNAEKEERLRPWAWQQPDGTYKLAPGFLLEYTEFQKGYMRGGAGISPQHTLTIINVAGARAHDIAQLARDMQDAVEKIFAVRLEREVEYVGAVERAP